MMIDTALLHRDSLFIGGRWVLPAAAGTITTTNPSTGQPLGSVPEGGAPDVEAAVAAARAARNGWAATSWADRVALCVELGHALERRRSLFEQLITAEVGAPAEFTTSVHVDAAIEKFTGMAEVFELLDEEIEQGTSRVERVPIGVVAAITPWNYPLLQVAEKVAPALVSGCTVILKPSELTPLSAFLLADAVEEVGFPAGVFNLVSGYGADVGELLAGHPLVDMVSFTGSTRTGRRISRVAAETVKVTMMELGGKSPSVILDDVDGDLLEEAVTSTILSCLENAGQTCSALTRLVVPRRSLAAVELIAKTFAATLTVGSASDAKSDVGPLVSETQRQRVVELVDAAEAAGARVLYRGTVSESAASTGYYYPVTILSDVDAQSVIAQSEVFGPVLVLIAAADDDEAIEIANSTEYGLAAAVWSTSSMTALNAAQRIWSGIVSINGGVPDHNAPFGGFKQSGHGRESGRFAIEEFTALRVLALPANR